jgi:membrane-associated phospholipid phosphatase
MKNKHLSLQTIIAEGISWIFNPAFLGLIILFIAIMRSPMDDNIKISWLLSASVLNGVIPFVFYLFFIKIGHPVDGPLSNVGIQKNRVLIYLIFLLVMALQIIILATTTPYQPFLLIITGGMLAAIIGLIVTNFWRISIHAGVATIFIIMIFYLFGFSKTWLILAILPLVFWSRIYLSRHTFWQLITGVIAALLVVAATFSIYGFDILKIFLS